MPSFNCPRRHRDLHGEPAGHCRRCEAFTGHCGASFLAGVLLATGAVDGRHPVLRITQGCPARWRQIVDAGQRTSAGLRGCPR
jgi:hypothetical protein